MESASISVLTRAVEFDLKGRYSQAKTCYEEGLGLLLDAIKKVDDEDKKRHLRQKAEEYMKRAEIIKLHIEKIDQAANVPIQIKIEEDSINHCYESIFGKYLDGLVKSVEIEDPYIRSVHQTYNFLRFSELLVKKCSNLKSILLKTSTDNINNIEGQERLEAIKKSLQLHNIDLRYELVNSLHDREIRLNTGWVFKIGRGLDYFKNVPKFHIGYCDYDLRPCKETIVDIFYKDKK